MNKYELTSVTKEVYGRTLYQIKALKSFANVTEGDLGGWIEKESNLSQEGASWVSGNARVYDNAQVFGNARVYGNAQVFGNARVYDNAQVYGNAWVSGDARVYDNAQVFGNAWVYGNAQVFGNARVYGNAQVFGNALVTFEVTTSTDYYCMGPQGSRDSYCTFGTTINVVNTGCFSGTLAEFRKQVYTKYPEGTYREQYDFVIASIQNKREVH